MSFKCISYVLFFFVTVLFSCLPFVVWAQKTTVSGMVTDATSGEPIPFANVRFSGTNIGVVTTFDGFYTLVTIQNFDSVTVSYIGYDPVHVQVQPYTSQFINFELRPTVINLREIVVKSGKYDNPAYAIINMVVQHKPQNDKSTLKAYEYESYSKIEVEVSNLSGALKRQKFIKDMEVALDTIKIRTDENGKSHLPIFFSETLSKYYYQSNPQLRKEEILKTRVKGVGIEAGGALAQLLGSSLQDYNFYDNWISFIDKKLVSPIADSWKLYYEYELVDSLYLGEDYCYEIQVLPRRKQDLAFAGTIWVTKKDFALKQLDLKIEKSANINFIDQIHIRQQLNSTNAGNWLPEKTSVVLTARPFHLNKTGLISNFYASIKNPVVNELREPEFFEKQLEVAPTAEAYSKDYWDSHRHDSLKVSEVQVIEMFEVVNADPAARRTIGLLKALGSGYFDVGKLEVGPLPFFYLYNNVEKHRIGMGLRTNKYFSKKVRFTAIGGYGTADKEFKYNLAADFIVARDRWTVLSASMEKEIEQVGLDPETIRANYFFYATSKWGKLGTPFFYRNKSLSLRTDLWKGGIFKFWVRSGGFEPLYPFQYTQETGLREYVVEQSYETTEIGAEVRLSKKENFATTVFSKVSMRNSQWPILSLRYVWGVKDILGGDFDYHKFSMKVYQKANLGVLGISAYTLEAGKTINRLPYPLLRIHAGNESIFYTSAAFSQMNYMEFISDTYTSLRFLHSFNGLILNRIPVIKKWKLRLLAQANILFGSLSNENRELLNTSGKENTLASAMGPLSKDPYIEVGYGVENIFRFIRIDAFHRLTYLDSPSVMKFGIKISAQLGL